MVLVLSQNGKSFTWRQQVRLTAVRSTTVTLTYADSEKEEKSGPAVLNVLRDGRPPGGVTWGHYWLLREDSVTPTISRALPQGEQRISLNGTDVGRLDKMCSLADRSSLSNRVNECNEIITFLNRASVAKADDTADGAGNVAFSGIPPGNYYMLVLVLSKNGTCWTWWFQVKLTAAANSTIHLPIMPRGHTP